MTDDYTRYPIGYKIKKVLRYTRLYGPGRTITKIKSQYHMKAGDQPLTERWENPRPTDAARKDIGIIGCGNFAFSHIAYFCDQRSPGCVRAAFDIAGGRSVSLAKKFGAVYAAREASEVIEDPAIKTVFVVSNHATHAEYGIQALAAGKRVHLEKPHVVNQDQLTRLIEVVQRTGNHEVYLGFNRPRSSHFRRIMEIASQESGPSMINWFVAGHEIPDDHWYFSEAEGGRILGNLCHWTDLTMRIVGTKNAFPALVVPGSRGKSKSDFALTFNFADESVATITFSAKGHTFEGVREYLNLHRGDALIALRDFHVTEVHRGAERLRFKTAYRDHGHKANIFNSFDGAEPEPMADWVATARLFLAAKQAIDEQKEIVVTAM